jgi:hypothetical protein
MEVITKPLPNRTGYINPKTIVLSPSAKVQTTTKQSRKANAQGGKMRLYRHLRAIERAIRTLRVIGTISSNGAGAMILAAFPSTGVTSSSDWTNFSQEFGNYRVRSIRFKLFPATVNATSVTGPYQGIYAIARWWGLSYSSESSIRQDPQLVVVSTLQEYAIETNHLGFPDATEFTPVGSTIPAERTYGFSAMSLSNSAVLALSSVIWTYVTEYETEFLNTH